MQQSTRGRSGCGLNVGEEDCDEVADTERWSSDAKELQKEMLISPLLANEGP